MTNPGADLCEVCGSAWQGGDVCGKCGWMRSPDAKAPSLELDIASAPPGVGLGGPGPAPGPPPASPSRAVGPQARGGRSGLQAQAPPAGARGGRQQAQGGRGGSRGFSRRTPGEKALASARRAGWIGLLVVVGGGGLAVRSLYPRLEVASRASDLRSDALKVVELSGQPVVSASVLQLRAAAWAKTQELTVVPGSLRVRIVRVPAPSTAGDAAAALGSNEKVGTDHWYRVTIKLTTHLSKWGYEKAVGIRASRILALTAAQSASPYKDDGQILDDEPELDGGPAKTKPAKAVAEALPGAGRDLSTEGSVTGLGLSVGRFLKDVTQLDAQVAELIGVKGLNVPADDLAWAKGRKNKDQVPVLQARADRLRERAAGLQEAVEVRYGLRLGKPWSGVGRALGLLKRTLGHLQEGSQASFVDGLDRYDQWHHAAMLKIQNELSSKGVFLGDAASAPPPPPGPGDAGTGGKGAAKSKKDSGPGVKVKKGKGRRGR